MKAAIYKSYGPPSVVQIADVPKPEPGDGEILIRLCSASLSSADCRLRSLRVPTGFKTLMRLSLGLIGPTKQILGTDLAGVVEAVGPGVTRFKEGDEIFADTGTDLGTHAQYKVMRGDGAIARKPNNLSLRQAAAIPFGGATALSFLRDKAKLTRGEAVLIHGASGSVGCAAVQLAKHLGAKVTAVCSAANVDLVSSLGADAVIDYRANDFANSGETYDVIMDNVGSAPWARSKSVLNPGGRLLGVAATLPQMLGALVPKRNGKKVICGMASADSAMLRYLSELVEAGQYTPVVDRSFPLRRIAEAHAYCDTGRKTGNVLIDLNAEV